MTWEQIVILGLRLPYLVNQSNDRNGLKRELQYCQL